MNKDKPKLGDIALGFNLGYSINNHSKYIYKLCKSCGYERWVLLKDIDRPRCIKCIGDSHWYDKSPVWKGGRNKTSKGYITISLKPSDFYFPMADRKHLVREHRLVMAKSLGRCLESWEIVHHINHKRDDNRIENLRLVKDDDHIIDSIIKTRIKNMESRIKELEEENRLLKLRQN